MVVWFTGQLLGAGQLLKQKEDREVFEQQQQQQQRQQQPEQATPVYLEDCYGHRQSQEKATVPAAATQQSTMNSTDNTRSTAISAATSYAADNDGGDYNDLVVREQEKFGTTACYVDCDDYTEEGTAAAPIDDDDAVVLDSVGIGSNNNDSKAGVRMIKKTKATGTSIRNLKVCGNSKRSMAMRSAVASGSCNSIGVGVDDALVEGKEDGIDGDDGCDGCDEPPVEISHDVYNMFFLSKNGPAFFYAFYVWFLKVRSAFCVLISSVPPVYVTMVAVVRRRAYGTALRKGSIVQLTGFFFFLPSSLRLHYIAVSPDGAVHVLGDGCARDRA